MAPTKRTKLQPKTRKKRNLIGLHNAVRTPGTIIRHFAMAPKGKQAPLSHYVQCRSDPFNGHGGSAIPDGQNSNFVVSDSFSINNISPSAAGQTIVIQTLNCLPALAMIGSLSNFTVDSQLVTALSSFVPSTTATTTWYPLSIPPSYAGIGSPGSTFADPYNSTTARMISLGYRLIYTGPATTCAGVITVTPNPVSWTPGGISAIGSLGIVDANSAGVAGAALTAGIPFLSGDFTINPTALTRASTTFRPEQGCYIVAPHKSTVYKNQQTYPNPFAPIGGFNTAIGATNMPCLLRQNPTVNPGIVWFDNDWQTFQIVISGVNADASYRLETVCCMEYNPAVSSVFYPLTIKSTVMKTSELVAAEKAVQAKPVTSSSTTT